MDVMKKDFDGWTIVYSRSGYHPEFGYPIGEFLCTSKQRALDHIENLKKETGLDDFETKDYVEGK